MNKQPTWIQKPNKQHLFWITLLWVLSIGLLWLATTDLLRETVFQRKNIALLLLVAGSTATIFLIYKNYYKNR